ncbi:MAG: hypothetical protein CR986_04445 [Ignavibacteriae bacterium]|nr:MAG: hypothetical protein CR986_04445 [Ignavibacteriota bacterium]
MRRITFLLVLLLFQSIFAQLKLKQFNSSFEQISDSLFFGLTKSRGIINLNNDWNAFLQETPENSFKVSFPLSFTSEAEIIFEREFTISEKDFKLKEYTLNFLRLNYSAEIFLNNAAIYKHPGGELPFSIPISEQILLHDSPNILRVKIQYSVDAENTIPLLQRFYFTKNAGGILSDIYLSYRPKVGIKKISYNLKGDKKPYKGRLNFTVDLKNFKKIVADSLLENFDKRFKLEAELKITGDTSRVYFNIWNINPLRAKNYSSNFYVRLRKIEKWKPTSPLFYELSVKLTNGEGYVFDEFRKDITFFNFKKEKNKLLLNGDKLNLNGVTYLRNNYQYKTIEEDIKIIKETGFNFVRFSKRFPHPYTVYLCKKYGLLALIELPLNSVPENFTVNNNFRDRAKSFLTRAISTYDKFENVIGYSAGGSFLSNSEKHRNFISFTNKIIKKLSPGKLTFTSLLGINDNPKIDADIYGIELYGKIPNFLQDKLSSKNGNDTLLYIISEATYPTYNGTTNGYLNKYSFEGQAKFFSDIISITKSTKLVGFVLNTMFDYSGDYTPFFAGYNTDNIYKIGLFSDTSNKPRISYNVIKSKLLSDGKVSVPIGSNNENVPLLFLIIALIISVSIALLMNSKRKFREDATRALLRPYNFFADIRDQRILSGFHSTILLILTAGANALLLTILLYFFRVSILFEKIILAFGSYKFSAFVGMLAWHPQKAFIYLYALSVGLFFIISFLVHLSSFFVKNRVLYSSVFTIAIWAFLPLVILLPVEAILYKILLLKTYNSIIFIVLILFHIWIFQRFLKGIYVIFDVRPMFVYLYSFLTIALVLLVVGIYFQYSVSFYDYLELTIKQHLTLTGK